MNASQTRKIELAIETSAPDAAVFQQHTARQLVSLLLDNLQEIEPTSIAAKRLTASLRSMQVEEQSAVVMQPAIRECLARASGELGDEEASRRRETLLSEAAEAIESSASVKTAAPGRSQIASHSLSATEWSAEWAKTEAGQYFDELFRKQVSKVVHFKPVTLADLTADQAATLQQGRRILRELLPSIAETIDEHVNFVALMDYDSLEDRQSQKPRDFNINILIQPLAGSVLMSPPALNDPYRAAEALLREGLGRVFSDMDAVNSFFTPKLFQGPPKAIPVVWNRAYQWRMSSRNPNSWANPYWSIERALGALYGFVHLAAFFDALSAKKKQLEALHGSILDIDPVASRKAAAERAVYLIRELKKVGAPELTPSGYAMIDWLTEFLSRTCPTAFDLTPDLSLYLDRFDNDTIEVTSIVDHIPDELATVGDWLPDAAEETWPLIRLVNQLIQNEIAAGHTLLYAIYHASEESPTVTLDRGRWSAQASVRVPFKELAKVFYNQRHYVSSMLRTALGEAGAAASTDWHKHAISYLTSDINDYSIKCVPLLAVRKKNLMG